MPCRPSKPATRGTTPTFASHAGKRSEFFSICGPLRQTVGPGTLRDVPGGETRRCFSDRAYARSEPIGSSGAPPPKKNAGRIRGESRPHDSPHFLIMAGLGKRRLSSCGRCPRRRRSLQSRERQKTRLPVRVLGPGSARFHRGPSRFCGLCPPRIAPCGGS